MSSATNNDVVGQRRPVLRSDTLGLGKFQQDHRILYLGLDSPRPEDIKFSRYILCHIVIAYYNIVIPIFTKMPLATELRGYKRKFVNLFYMLDDLLSRHLRR